VILKPTNASGVRSLDPSSSPAFAVLRKNYSFKFLNLDGAIGMYLVIRLTGFSIDRRPSVRNCLYGSRISDRLVFGFTVGGWGDRLFEVFWATFGSAKGLIKILDGFDAVDESAQLSGLFHSKDFRIFYNLIRFESQSG
jgi:hypothetical protein